MRFEKELDQESVPEWRAKYLDYKVGKAKIKACAKAIEKANKTPRSFRTPSLHRVRRPSIPEPLLASSRTFPKRAQDDTEQRHAARARTERSSAISGIGGQGSEALSALQAASGKFKLKEDATASTETQPLKSPSGADQGSVSYGSIGSTPRSGPVAKLQTIGAEALETIKERFLGDRNPSDPTLEFPNARDSQFESPGTRKTGSSIWKSRSKSVSGGPPSLKLPEPALGSHRDEDGFEISTEARPSHDIEAENLDTGTTLTGHGTYRSDIAAPPLRSLTSPFIPSRKPAFLKRVLSTYSYRGPPRYGISLEAYHEFDNCQDDFFQFMNQELDKIEGFYKKKEEESTQRLETLKEQLKLMKIRQAEEADERRRRLNLYNAFRPGPNGLAENGAAPDSSRGWATRITQSLQIDQTRLFAGGKTDKQRYHQQQHDNNENTQIIYEVPFKEAKSRLKHALQDFYKNLDMLKSYATLNRTAFRKINKKYDKAIDTRQPRKFMSEKVDQAWFVQSNVLEGHMKDVEYLYARYFTKGSHKIAVRKLRVKHQSDHSLSTFNVGLLLGAGTVFAVRALMFASDIMEVAEPTIINQSSYLLQIYGGYFLALFLFFLFCLDCKVWLKQKINYVFIFEFDTRHSLDWRQLAEIPSLLWFLLGLIMWLNFREYGSDYMFLYWPVVLIGLSCLIIFMPLRFLYHRSRLWWATSNGRLYAAGLYSVEFRDFLLGDMYCSLTYTMGNIELFFCLYGTAFNNPSMCGSSGSRLFGFFTCLPGIWRALQCLRRYRDTSMVFPHVANFGKYLCGVLFYMSLSLYRIQHAMDGNNDSDQQVESHETVVIKACFILFATINSIYVSLWDLLIDWSLGNANAEWPFLREPLGFSWPPVYYIAMIIDPLIRFNWIFYVLLSGELQHSALVSFFIGLSEICRRAFWALFRVENEHMTNVGMFRASRDIPLPYDVPVLAGVRTDGAEEERSGPDAAIEAAPTGQSMRPLGTPRRIGTALTMAHAHDFQRKHPEESSSDEEDDDEGGGSGDDALDESGSMVESEEEDNEVYEGEERAQNAHN